MVSSIYSGMSPQLASSTDKASLSDDQKQAIMDVLEEFDANDLTVDDAASILQLLKIADILPGPELFDAMAEAGFDGYEVALLARGRGSAVTLTEQSEAVTLNISDEKHKELNALLDSYYSDDLSDAEKEVTLATIMNIFEQAAPEDGLLKVTV